jgi:CHASE2 domain-containing sensor protein
LFHDRQLQVNIAVGKSGFVKEVVVISRTHGVVIHAQINSEAHLEYILNREILQVADSKFSEAISTRNAPFDFKQSPLNELVRYHVNALIVRSQVTIVGGTHPHVGGFFNVAVRRRPFENEFPSVLQLPFHPNREAGFFASIIPDVWLDLQTN